MQTAVFTPIEYGCVKLSDEEAIKRHREDSIEVYHQTFRPYEWGPTSRDVNTCFFKVFIVKKEEENVIDLHFLGSSARKVKSSSACYSVVFRLVSFIFKAFLNKNKILVIYLWKDESLPDFITSALNSMQRQSCDGAMFLLK